MLLTPYTLESSEETIPEGQAGESVKAFGRR